MNINIRSSYDSFRDLRENDSYYIDKTGMLKEYLVDKFDKAVMFARPRRFGKTLTMTMFRDFLDINQDSIDIFSDLEIMKYPDVVKKYMNKYPVIFISLKEVFGENFESCFRNFQMVISKLCDDHKYLLDSPKVDQSHKKFFEKLKNRDARKEDTEQALDLISSMLRDYFEKQVFIIIDEYDVPMAKSLGTPYYDRIRDMVEHMLSYICKTNDNIKAVLLSGCLYTVKNSAYTGVNNINPYTVLSPNYDSYIGFTDTDVRKILNDAKLEERFDTVSEWYDGYVFGRTKMYCPWDVLCYIKSLIDDSYSEAMGPENYWLNSSETNQDIIHGFLGKTPGITKDFEDLLAGKSIDCTVSDNIPYHKIHDKGDNIWSALLETGYLTKTVFERMPRMPLKIPNREICEVFRQEVWDYFKDKIENKYVDDLVDSLWKKSTESVETNLNQILEATLSFYHEYHEYSYHLILDGFFTGRGYRVLSELESGYGRSDLIILDPLSNRCLILELKHVDQDNKIQEALNEATTQIIEKKYDSVLKYHCYDTVIRYGMVFCDKRAVVKEI